MKPPPVQVEHEEFTFSAPSDTSGEPDYLVDLECHNGDADCSCKDFDINRRFARKNGEDNPDKIQCKHIIRSIIEWAYIQDPRLRDKPRRYVLVWGRVELKRQVMRKRRMLRKMRESKH